MNVHFAAAAAAAVLALLPRSVQNPSEAAHFERARSHYTRVIEELEARDVSALAPETRARRAELLAELASYRDAGAFTRWIEPGARVPVFVDDAEAHCAVANLLRYSGDTDLVARVNAADNHAWVWDLRDEPGFQDWLAEHGLTFGEAARIQFPGIQPSDGPPPPSPAAPGADGPASSGGGAGRPAPSPGGGVAAPATPSAVPGMPRTPDQATAPPTLGGEALTDWGIWWEYNKLAWLRPRPLGGRADDDGSQSESELAGARRRARARLAAELESPHASVRAAAAVAFARAAGAAACEPLEELLSDASRQVRLAAIAGFAATGSEEGVHALLTVVHAKEEPAPGLRAAAIVALAAAADEGVGAEVGAMLKMILRAPDDDERYALATYADMASDPALVARADGGRKRDRRENVAVASRELEALHAARSEEVLSELLDAANGRKVESRRGALLALGELEGALEPLMTAYEGESDALGRGFALLSIGRHGGAAARAFLVRELERGPSAARPWCALALGVLADDAKDAAACAALRAGYAQEKVRSARGAYLLALGAAGDVESEPLLREALLARDAPTRAYAAQGLGLLVTVRSREALRAALVAEGTPLVRTALAQALALHGDGRDVELLLAELDTAKSPLLRGQVAAALGFHGSRDAVDGLLARLESDRLQGESRAAALGALAVGLSGRDRIALSRASAWSNHAVFPDWLLEMLQQPL